MKTIVIFIALSVTAFAGPEACQNPALRAEIEAEVARVAASKKAAPAVATKPANEKDRDKALTDKIAAHRKAKEDAAKDKPSTPAAK